MAETERKRGVPVDISYEPAEQVLDALGLLGVVGLGARRPPGIPPDCPFAALAAPLLAGGPALEIWRADGPVRFEKLGEVACAMAPGLLFGLMEVDPDGDLAATTRRAYARLFELAETAGCPNLLRVHNYLPRITAIERGEERYRAFNAGRHAAFADRRRGIETAPAACGLGPAEGPLLIYFLAGSGQALPIENPRQVSAYRYPPRYGRRSPTFSRALVGEGLLFLSGTASIVGHESLHPGDAAAQTGETVVNLRVLLAQCRAAGFAAREERMRLKVYVKRRADLPVVAEQLATLLGPAAARAVYLQADICRPELLVEAEGVCPLER